MTRGAEAGALPVLHRLAILYLMLPVVVWLAGWFQWWLGVPAVAGLGLALGPALKGSWRGRPRPAVWGILLAALVWVMFTAAGGVFDSFAEDWRKHRAILLDLSRYPWPTYLPDGLMAYMPAADPPAAPPLLCYYLGWYMVPGLVGRIAGPAALQWAVPLWTWMGASLVLLLFTRARRGRNVVLTALIFVFFSGMDFLRVWWLEGWSPFDLGLERQGWPGLATGRALFDTNSSVRLAALSHTYALAWSPQHFLPAGLYTLLLLQLRRRTRFLAVSGVLLAAAPFWSVFVALGLLPWLAVTLRDNGLRPFLRWPNAVLAAPLAGLVTLYLTAAALDFPQGWIWEIYDGALLARWMPTFYLTEIIPLALPLWLLQPRLRREAFWVVSVVVLLLAPLYFLGQWNDLPMRLSMPALLALSYYGAHVVTAPGVLRARSRWRRFGFASLLLALGIGSLTAFHELARATRDDYPFRYARAGDTVLIDLPASWQRHNVAFDAPPALRALLRPPPAGPAPIAGPKGELVARHGFRIYWDAPRIVYAKERCSQADVASPLFLEVVPAVRADAPRAFRRQSLDASGHAFINRFLRAAGTGCGLIRELPALDIVAVRTGQRLRGQGNWETEMRFGAGGLGAVAVKRDRDFRAAYRAATAGEPAVRSFYAVYFADRAATYARAPCVPEDTEAKFTLHVIPRHRASLPWRRWLYGFDNLGFAFARSGVRVDDQCFVTVPLPAYDIARIRTGQFVSSRQRNVWQAETPFVPARGEP